MLSLVLGCLLGLASGARHALEPDHLAAVSAMVAEQRSARRSFGFAAAWGLGHASMLLGVGGALLAARASMPGPVEDAFEVVVAIVLVALGARAVARALRDPGPPHLRGEATPPHGRDRSSLLRPLAVGVVHGLAGSGALTALAVSRSPSLGAGLAFLALYGAGATLGMAALAGIVGVPLARLARRPTTGRVLLALAGAASLLMGIAWGGAAVLRIAA